MPASPWASTRFPAKSTRPSTGKNSHEGLSVAMRVTWRLRSGTRPIVLSFANQSRFYDATQRAGAGGFLCNAYQYVLDRFEKDLDADEKRALREGLIEGMELSPKVDRRSPSSDLVWLHDLKGRRIQVANA
jgi:hypothetical protein